MKIFILLLLLSVSCGKNTRPSSDVVPSREESREPQHIRLEEQYLALVNNHRLSLGLPPLIYAGIIEEVSKDHSEAMAFKKRPFGHGGWKGRCRTLYSHLHSSLCGEIVAYGQKTPEDVLRAWLNSPPHRKALENPRFVYTGLGRVVSESGRIYWTQMFSGASVSSKRNRRAAVTSLRKH